MGLSDDGEEWDLNSCYNFWGAWGRWVQRGTGGRGTNNVPLNLSVVFITCRIDQWVHLISRLHLIHPVGPRLLLPGRKTSVHDHPNRVYTRSNEEHGAPLGLRLVRCQNPDDNRTEYTRDGCETVGYPEKNSRIPGRDVKMIHREATPREPTESNRKGETNDRDLFACRVTDDDEEAGLRDEADRVEDSSHGRRGEDVLATQEISESATTLNDDNHGEVGKGRNEGSFLEGKVKNFLQVGWKLSEKGVPTPILRNMRCNDCPHSGRPEELSPRRLHHVAIDMIILQRIEDVLQLRVADLMVVLRVIGYETEPRNTPQNTEDTEQIEHPRPAHVVRDDPRTRHSHDSAGERTRHGDGDEFAPFKGGSPLPPYGVHAGECDPLEESLKHTYHSECVWTPSSCYGCYECKQRRHQNTQPEQILSPVFRGEVAARNLRD